MKINILNYETYIYEFTYEIYTMIHIFCYPKVHFSFSNVPEGLSLQQFTYKGIHYFNHPIDTLTKHFANWFNASHCWKSHCATLISASS